MPRQKPMLAAHWENSTLPSLSGGDILERAPEPYAAHVRAPHFPENAVWINSPPVRLPELRGKVVLLDFWTSGCINCVHILPNLHRLHQAFPGRLEIIGVHTPKFPAEKDAARLALAVERLGIEHPVVSDPDYAIWQSFAVDAWPTLVFLDPAGRVVARHAGEFDYDLVHAFIAQLLGQSAQAPGPPGGLAPLSPEGDSLSQWERARGEEGLGVRRSGSPNALHFPGKLTVDPAGERLFVADTGNHRIIVSTLTGQIQTVIGRGLPGADDGSFDEATFDNPQGMALAPDGAALVVADTGNHLIRRVDLDAKRVETIAGTGARGFPSAGGPARETPIASPWDVIWFEGRSLIAMAGTHQIWGFDPTARWIEPVAGTGVESIHDDRFLDATFAQPSGLTALGRTVFVADSESSAVRALDFDTGRVRRILGRGLFHFGDLDAIGDSVRLQHPQGIVAAEENGKPVLYLADTFNNKIKKVDPLRRKAVTIAGAGEQGDADGHALDADFREPSGLALHERMLYIADTHNHRIRMLDLDRGVVASMRIS